MAHIFWRARQSARLSETDSLDSVALQSAVQTTGGRTAATLKRPTPPPGVLLTSGWFRIPTLLDFKKPKKGPLTTLRCSFMWGCSMSFHVTLGEGIGANFMSASRGSGACGGS